MSQIALVSHQHDHDIGVCVVSQLLQPAGDVFKGEVLGDVIDEEGPDSTAVVGRRNGPVALLAGGVPDLRLDGL